MNYYSTVVLRAQAVMGETGNPSEDSKDFSLSFSYAREARWRPF